MKNKEELTIDELNNIGSVYDAINYAQKFYPEYKPSLTKPFLRRGASSSEAKKYAQELEEYEIDKIYWDNQKKLDGIETQRINNLLEELVELFV